MADESGLSPFVFACQGGLVLDQSTFAMQPGMALELQNFEPDISGGYRRISGYAKWNSNIVPQTAASTEPVLMVLCSTLRLLLHVELKYLKLVQPAHGQK